MAAKKLADTSAEKPLGWGIVPKTSGVASALAEVEKGNISLVPTDKLVPLYQAVSNFSDNLQSILKRIKKEFIEFRLNEGTPSGDKNQHRKFTSGDTSLTFQKKKVPKLNVEAAETYLRKKKLWDRASDMTITAGTEDMRGVVDLLAKHGKSFRGVTFKFEESLNEAKLKALVDLGEVSLADFESLITTSESYAVIQEAHDRGK